MMVEVKAACSRTRGLLRRQNSTSEAKVSMGASVPEVRTRLCAPRARSRNAMAGLRLHRHSWTTSALEATASSWLEPLHGMGHATIEPVYSVQHTIVQHRAVSMSCMQAVC